MDKSSLDFVYGRGTSGTPRAELVKKQQHMAFGIKAVKEDVHDAEDDDFCLVGLMCHFVW